MRIKDDKKRDAIYKAAIALVNEHGLGGTSMSMIARAANVSPATLYIHFENKEDMLNKLYLMVKEDASGPLLEGIEEGMEVQQAFECFIRNQFAYYLVHVDAFSFQDQFFNSALIRDDILEAGHAFYAPLLGIYKRGIDEGKLVEVDLPISLAFIYDPVNSLIRAHHHGKYKVDETVIQRTCAMAWNAIKTG